MRERENGKTLMHSCTQREFGEDSNICTEQTGAVVYTGGTSCAAGLAASQDRLAITASTVARRVVNW